METAGDSEKAVYFYQPTRRHTAENRTFVVTTKESELLRMSGAANSYKTLELYTKVNGDLSRSLLSLFQKSLSFSRAYF
jgi:hypothetical protein